MLLIIGSFICFIFSGFAFVGASYFSYLAENVWAAHALLTIACWFIFLTSLAFALIGSTDRNGRQCAPDSLAVLISYALLIPQVGFAIGGSLNYRSSLEIMSMLENSYGVEAYLVGDDMISVDGVIGLRTFESLSDQYASGDFSFLELKSGGGLISEASKISSFVEEQKIAVLVRENCESACVIIALASSEVYVSRSARFGFHRASAIASPDSELGRFIGNSASIEYIDQLRKLNVPDYILRNAQATPPEEMFYVSGMEMYDIGLADHLVD